MDPKIGIQLGFGSNSMVEFESKTRQKICLAYSDHGGVMLSGFLVDDRPIPIWQIED